MRRSLLASHVFHVLPGHTHVRINERAGLPNPPQQLRLPEVVGLALFSEEHPEHQGVPTRAQLPEPTKDSLRVFNYAVAQYYGRTHRIHARKSFRGAPRYSWVMLDSGDKERPWFGRLLALLSMDCNGRKNLSYALVQYLEDVVPVREHVIEARHFRYAHTQPTLVSLGSILQPAYFLTSPLRHRRDGALIFLAQPYGVSHASTTVGWEYESDTDGDSDSTGDEVDDE